MAAASRNIEFAPAGGGADLGHHRLGEVLGARLDHVGGGEKHGAALARAQRRPGGKSVRPRFGGRDCVRNGRRRGLARHQAGERVDPLEGPPVGGGHFAVADHEVDAQHACSLPPGIRNQ
jgi:hypothetical protein